MLRHEAEHRDPLTELDLRREGISQNQMSSGRRERSSAAIKRLDLSEPPSTKLVLARQVREHTWPVRAELLA